MYTVMPKLYGCGFRMTSEGWAGITTGETRMDQTRTLVRFLARLDRDAIPDAVIARARIHVLDTIGVAIGGSQAIHAKQALATIAALGTPGHNTVIASAMTTSVLEAAFLNGVMAHSIDFDDAHKFVHAGCVVVPTALAFAQATNASAQNFLVAVIAGYEASVRLSLAGGPSHRARGFHPTGTCNVVGAAIAAGLLLGLNEDQLVSAVGIACSQAAGLTQYRIDGAATKHLHAGFAARSGGFAALLAQNGIRGPEAAIEGEVGFLKAFADEVDPDALVRGLGEIFAIAQTDIKPFPSCRQTHAPVDLMLKLIAAHNLDFDQIEGVELATYKYIDKPWHTGTEPPGSALEAMLNIPYCLASAAANGRLTLKDFEPEALQDPRVLSLMTRTAITFDEALTARWPGERGAILRLDTPLGRFESQARNPRGGVDEPVEWTEALTKFHGLADPVLGPDKARTIAQAIATMPDSGGLTALLAALSGPDRAAQAA